MNNDPQLSVCIKNATTPLVSVGVPVFNGEKYIREAIDSILNQDCESMEIVISDNASTDSTQSICEEYVNRDSRVRYYRNTQNLGASVNFKQTLALARGVYFTWLAHDDSFCDRDYLTAITIYMEQHSDVVLCGSSVRIIIAENHREEFHYVPEPLLPEKPWREARLEFFRWPQTPTHFVIYGVYRREMLLKIPMDGRMHRGKSVVVDMEYPILASLCLHGRIVALPQVKRVCRALSDSAGCRGMETLLTYDHLCLAFRTRLTLLNIGLKMRLPLIEKVQLFKVLLGNFFRAQLGGLHVFRANLKELRDTIAMLQGVCEERLDLINQFHVELEKRLQLINRLDMELKHHSEQIQKLQHDIQMTGSNQSV